MSLTAAQRETVFEILDVPSLDKIGEMVDNNNICTFVLNYGDSAKRTSAYVDLMLNWIATQTALEAMLVGYIERWDEIGTDPSVQQSGQVGNLSGITDDPTAELKIIRGRVKRILAIRRWDEFISSVRDSGVPSGPRFINAVAG
jgi:hypothetical protein